MHIVQAAAACVKFAKTMRFASAVRHNALNWTLGRFCTFCTFCKDSAVFRSSTSARWTLRNSAHFIVVTEGAPCTPLFVASAGVTFLLLFITMNRQQTNVQPVFAHVWQINLNRQKHKVHFFLLRVISEWLYVKAFWNQSVLCQIFCTCLFHNAAEYICVFCCHFAACQVFCTCTVPSICVFWCHCVS